MADQVVEQVEQKPMKRFNNYEEFLATFYPKSSQDKAKEKEQGNEGFGAGLALGSLSRHAGILRFGDR